MQSAPFVDPGHTVLAVPVPALDAYVRARTQHYDADYLAADPQFGQAHVTLLAPWQREPTAADRQIVADLCAAAEPFEYGLAELGVFADGIVHLLADPADRFAAMTRELRRKFPGNVPYDGQFDHLVPHVTLDALGPGVDTESVRSSLGELVPLRCRAELVQLQWWQAGRCHVQQTWQLGGSRHASSPDKGDAR